MNLIPLKRCFVGSSKDSDMAVILLIWCWTFISYSYPALTRLIIRLSFRGGRGSNSPIPEGGNIPNSPCDLSHLRIFTYCKVLNFCGQKFSAKINSSETKIQFKYQ